MFIRHRHQEPQTQPAGQGGGAGTTPPAPAPVAPPAPAPAPAPAAPAAPPAPVQVALTAEMQAQLARLPTIEKALSDANAWRESVTRAINPSAPGNVTPESAQAILTSGESALREAHVANLASRISNGAAYDSIAVAKLMGADPALAVNLQTRTLANPAAAEAAVRAHLAANPWMVRTAPVAAPNVAAPVIPGTTTVAPTPTPPAPAAGGAPPIPQLSVHDAFSVDLKVLRQ